MPRVRDRPNDPLTGSVPAQRAEWSFGKDPDLMIEIWTTASLVGAVIEALLEEPEKLRAALQALGASNPAPESPPQSAN